MGTGGGIWDGSDLISHERMNQKTQVISTTEPAIMYAGMLWFDISGVGVFKQRNKDNTAWIVASTGINYAPTGVEFGSTTQEYDITGTTWVTAVAGGALGGIPDETNVGHKLANCLTVIATARDNTYLAVREKTGAASPTNPLTIQFLFTGIINFDTIKVRSYYVGSLAHNISIQLWNYGTSAWDTFDTFSGQTGYVDRALLVFNPTSYISSGNVKLQYIHTSSGIASHYIQFDYIALGIGSGAGGLVIASAVQYSGSGIFASTTNVQTALDEINTTYLDQPVKQASSPTFSAIYSSLSGGLAIQPYGMQLNNEQIQFGNGSNAYENVFVSRTALDTLTLQGNANIYFRTGASGAVYTQIDASGNLIVTGYIEPTGPVRLHALGSATAGAITGMLLDLYPTNHRYGIGLNSGGYLWTKSEVGWYWYSDDGATITSRMALGADGNITITGTTTVSGGVLTLNKVGENHIKFYDGTISDYIGMAHAGDQLVTGSIQGDLVIRSGGRSILFTNDGTSIGAKIDASGNFSIAGNIKFKPSTHSLWLDLYTTDMWTFVTDYTGSNTYPLMIQPTNTQIRIGDGWKISWGSLGSSDDVNLYRSSANILKTDDQFRCTDIKVGTPILSGDQGGIVEITAPLQTAYVGTLTLVTNNTQAANTGGILSFRGCYDGTTSTATFAAIGGFKANNINTDYDGFLKFYTRTSGGDLKNTLTIFPCIGGLWSNIANGLTYGICINYNTGITWTDVLQIFNGSTTQLAGLTAAGVWSTASSIYVNGATSAYLHGYIGLALGGNSSALSFGSSSGGHDFTFYALADVLTLAWSSTSHGSMADKFSFDLNGNFSLTGNINKASAIGFLNSSNAQSINAKGILLSASYSDPAPNTAGIQFGADCNMYRFGANYLGTDDDFIAGMNAGSYGVGLTHGYKGLADQNRSEICNDIGGTYKALMILGNTSGDSVTRRVKIWDYLQVNGDLQVTGTYRSSDNSAGIDNTIAFYDMYGSYISLQFKKGIYVA